MRELIKQLIADRDPDQEWLSFLGKTASNPSMAKWCRAMIQWELEEAIRLKPERDELIADLIKKL